jgi:hypothetical protein
MKKGSCTAEDLKGCRTPPESEAFKAQDISEAKLPITWACFDDAVTAPKVVILLLMIGVMCDKATFKFQVVGTSEYLD